MRADIHGGPEQKLQSEAGYIDARPQTDSSTKTSCNARPDHTFGSNSEVGPLERHVRSTPNSRRRRTTAPCPGCAIDRDRGEPRGSAPPTPPCVRVRTRRFEKLG